VSTVEIDSYVVETLLPDLVGHDRQPSAFLVYLYLWYRMRDAVPRSRAIALSLRALAEGTGLSKRAVQSAVALLERRKLVAIVRAGPTAIPEYAIQRPWAARRARVG
jgi:hypothetical protein